MKRLLLSGLFIFSAMFAVCQTTYYWVGGTAAATGITTGANWNTSIDGLGSSRPSSTGATDILVFDGTNLGGTTPATGPAIILANSSITCAQVKVTNNAFINFVRATSGTSTITVSGGTGDDFVVDAGSTFAVPATTAGSMRFAMAATCTGRVNGTVSIISGQQFRFDNTTSGLSNAFVFGSGSSFTTNITSASSSYAFGSGTQSAEKWVVFEDGAHLYYEGGYSPMGGTTAYSAIDFKPGSVWHHRANNGLGSFLSRKSFGHISVENNATLTADGPVYRINNLTVTAGATFLNSLSGQTAILGNLQVDGTFSTPAGANNEVILAGNTTQTISGTGTINVANLLISDNANVVLSRNVIADQGVIVNGKLNFNTNQLTGAATFTASGIAVPGAGTANTVAGSYVLRGVTGISSAARGQTLTGPGLAPNTVLIAFSATSDSVFVSQPATATATAVAISSNTAGATLETANTNGFNPVNGSAALSGNKVYNDSINYIINAATTVPFGISTGSTATSVHTGSVVINAPVTVNSGVTINEFLTLNGKMILRAGDTVRILTGALINGTPGATNYIATDYTLPGGLQSLLRYDNVTGTVLLPIGTVNYYLPATVTPVNASAVTAAVFEGITSTGTITGTALTPAQRQTVVNAVWNINRLSGAGNADLQLGWDVALEGSSFTTLPSTDIGLIINNGSSWSLPNGTGDNSANTVLATISAFGSFGAGAIPPTQPFLFNPLPDKVYGNPDFNGGATSLNTTQPIIYTSSNPAVATIVSGDIHITGAGTADITASQASDGFYPAASVTRTLTVSKAALTITADNKLKFEGQVNPVLTATYTGFVLGETPTALLTPAVLATTAVTASAPGTYPITVSGATSNNYTITFVPGVMTVQPKTNQTITFNTIPVKTYGNADFPVGATSTNNTIPLTYSSSNTSVAVIVGNTIRITGAGTAVITVSQAGNEGYFPAADVQRTLTVNKVNLTIRVMDTTKVQGQANPVFRVTYTGFVLGETVANLTTAPAIATTAETVSAPGYYTLTPGGAVSQNYNFIYVTGRLTIYPPGGNTGQYINAFMSGSGTLTVRVFTTEPALGDIVLWDMSGKPLARKNLYMAPGFSSADLSVALLPSGMYVVTVKGQGVDLRKTIVIIK
jgi:hypothetical protein